VIWLKVTSIGGCSDYAQHDIKIVPDVLVYIPNAFTPDGDELNDGFGFKGQGVGPGFEFRIFNRWGEQLFFTTDVTQLWKGDNKGVACPEDVYVYSILYKDSDGKQKKILGHVTLIR
jgi:gliding motility-associated-like protein